MAMLLRAAATVRSVPSCSSGPRGFSSLSCGLIGLPNVGKSAIFNALTRANVPSENYPFCTIDPNHGAVALQDRRLETLAAISGSARTVPAILEFVDIAGLIKGASEGKGLGNKFLDNIRSTSCVLHVVRCFEDTDVIHVTDSTRISPVDDVQTIETELVLADLQSVEKRLAASGGRKAPRDAREAATRSMLERVRPALESGIPARVWLEQSVPGGEDALPADDRGAWRQLGLITQKPMLLLCNVDEASAAKGNALSHTLQDWAARERPGCEVLRICAPLEHQLADLEDPAERREMLDALGVASTGLEAVQHAATRLLARISYFTTGPQETRAWLIRRGASAPEAAGAIHSDFERGFIRADVIAFDDYVQFRGERGARDNGRLRSEGRDYVMQDGDVCVFKHRA